MSSKLEILLVEDNPYDAELTLHALKSCNLSNHLVHVEDGQAALDFIFGTGAHVGRNVLDLPKVVLLDLHLPNVDGIEVLRQMKADERTKLVPVVILTSSREERDVHATYQAGANSYIVKPVDFEIFLEAVSDMATYWVTSNVNA